LTFTAIDARNEAQQRRNDAEGQIEFMLTDLKDKLKGVGRLDALEIVGQRALEYYDQYPVSAHDTDALGRKARVFHYLGEVQDQLGGLEAAERYFKEAYEITETQLDTFPENPDRIFEHAQSVYWIARGPWIREEYDKVIPLYEAYRTLAVKLRVLEDDSERGILETAYADTNLGSVSYSISDYESAKFYFERSIKTYQELLEIDSKKNKTYQLDFANAHGWLSDSLFAENDLEKSIEYRRAANDIHQNLCDKFDDDFNLKYEFMVSNIALSILYYRGEYWENANQYIEKADFLSEILLSRDQSNEQWVESADRVDLIQAKILEQMTK